MYVIVFRTRIMLTWFLTNVKWNAGSESSDLSVAPSITETAPRHVLNYNSFVRTGIEISYNILEC